jgi:chromodomain-helicase-DNA-binding protein 1
MILMKMTKTMSDQQSRVAAWQRPPRLVCYTSCCLTFLTFIASKAHTPRARTSDDDGEEDEDEEFYTNVRKQTSRKTKQRQKDVANGVALPSDYQRFSSRRKVAITTYNEGEEDDAIDDDDVAEWEEYDAEAEAAPTIDIVLDHRIKEGRSLADEKVNKNFFEYLIKWQDQAHYHATWLNPREMDSKIKGVRKLDNYFEKVIRQFIWLEKLNASADEREMIQTQYQQKLDEYETNRNLERIVDVRKTQLDDDSFVFEYLVKWTNLHYKGCTWETEDLVNKLSPDAIAQYDRRQANIPQSNKAKSWHRGPTAFKWIKEQPSYIETVTMRDFQMTGLNFIAMNWHKRKNVILADEMGLGKTVQTVAFISYLVNEQEQEGLHLVVIPLSTLSAWQETFANWAPGLNVVAYTGAGRDIIQDHEILVNGHANHPRCNVILTTREMVKHDLPFFQSLQYQFLAVDEAHILKNPNALVYTQLNSLNIPGKLLITGTPMQNTVDELQALLEFLNPG